MYTQALSSVFLSFLGKIYFFLLWCNACLTIVWCLSLSKKQNWSLAYLFVGKLMWLWFLAERFQCTSPQGNGDAVRRGAGLIPAESLDWREGSRERGQRSSVIWESLVSTDSVTSLTPVIAQGAAVLALQIFCVRGKLPFSTLWVLPGSFSEERS